MAEGYENGARLGPLEALADVLRIWRELNRLEGQRWWRIDRDVPWWHNERVSLSFFSGAVWLTGGYAVGEMRMQKRVPHTILPRRYKGRNDLLLRVGRTQYVAEAKQCWPGITRGGAGAREMIQESLRAACADVRRGENWGYPRLGMTFAPPGTTTTAGPDLDDLLREYVTMLKDLADQEGAAVAWVFPHSLRRVTSKQGDYYPGTALLIKKL